MYNENNNLTKLCQNILLEYLYTDISMAVISNSSAKLKHILHSTDPNMIPKK